MKRIIASFIFCLLLVNLASALVVEKQINVDSTCKQWYNLLKKYVTPKNMSYQEALKTKFYLEKTPRKLRNNDHYSFISDKYTIFVKMTTNKDRTCNITYVQPKIYYPM